MTDEERQRTMSFILEQMAQLATSAQRNEEEHAQFTESFKQLNRSVSQLGRIAAGMARRYRHDRTDLRERVAALIDAQMKSEEKQSRTDKWQALMEESFARSDARMTRLEEEAERSSKDIASLFQTTKRNSEAIEKLSTSQDRNSEAIAKLTEVVAGQSRPRNGGES